MTGIVGTKFAVLGTLAALATAGAVSAAEAQTGITIYNDGRVLVRRTVDATVGRGRSEQRVGLGAIDPATLFSLDSAVNILTASYDGAVDEASALRRAVGIGKRITFRIPESKDTVSALVLGVDPLRLELPDGRVAFSMPGLPLYPRESVVTEPTLRLAVDAAASRRNLQLGYFTDGASWQASYQVVLGAGAARVTGAAVVPSQTLKVDDAEVQLLAGSVNRAQPQAPVPMYDRRVKMSAAGNAFSEMAVAGEQRVGEFHVYTLAGRWSLLPGLTTSIALFEPARAPYERNYVVRGALPYWGFFPQQGDEMDVPVEVSYTVKRPRKTEFGDRPLPGGVARLYQADSAGRLQLVGEASTDHTPAGKDLELDAGQAFDLTAKRVQTSYVTRRDSTKATGWRTIATADYRVTLTNATDSAVVVEVREERAGEWSIVSSSVPAEKVSSTRVRFKVAVPARGEAAVTYRVRAVW